MSGFIFGAQGLFFNAQEWPCVEHTRVGGGYKGASCQDRNEAGLPVRPGKVRFRFEGMAREVLAEYAANIIIMIISHRHKFIFIKTRKTGGSSVEIALSKHCGKGDIITPITPIEDDALRSRLGHAGPRDYAKPLWEYTAVDWGRLLVRRNRPMTFWNHMPAKEIKQRVGDQIWGSYFKFSIERNPWDKAISYYYWYKAQSKGEFSLMEFLCRERQPVSNYDVYAIDGKIEVDYMLFYESLKEQMAEISDIIGFPESLSIDNIHTKGNIRKDKRPYTEVLDDRERTLIELLCHREIQAFNYQFDDPDGKNLRYEHSQAPR